jgi:hypothetical protein
MQIDPLMKAWLQDACLDLAKARETEIRKTDYNSFDDWTEDYYEEVLLLRKKVEKYETILRHAMSEKTGVFFICGVSGEKDSMGLPEKIMVCPTYGLDGFASYKKDSDYSAPGW